MTSIQSVSQFPGRSRPREGAGCFFDKDKVATLLVLDCGNRNRQGLSWRGDRNRDPDKHAGMVQQLGIVQLRDKGKGEGRRGDRGADEADLRGK